MEECLPKNTWKFKNEIKTSLFFVLRVFLLLKKKKKEKVIKIKMLDRFDPTLNEYMLNFNNISKQLSFIFLN